MILRKLGEERKRLRVGRKLTPDEIGLLIS